MKKYLVGIIAITVVAVVVGSGAVGAASNTLNGANSKNKIKINHATVTSVGQFNASQQVNTVFGGQNTGGNKTNKNTNGDVSNTSGNTGSGVGIENNANINEAAIANCGCAHGNGDAVNAGNGADSKNKIVINNSNTTLVTQSNVATQVNGVVTEQNTGNNSANKNTGGNVDLSSGDATTIVSITNNANTNALVIGQ